MRGSYNYLPSTGGVSWPGVGQEVAWAKASFHVDNGAFTVELSVDGILVGSKAVTGGTDVVIEGTISPIAATNIALGLYPVAGSISNITFEWADADQAPSTGLGSIFDWIKNNPLIAAGIAVGVYLVVKGK